MNIKCGREMKRLHFHIVVIGGGANGSHFIRSLCQDIATYRKVSQTWRGGPVQYEIPFDITLYAVDADRVETKNLSNQLFDKGDVEQYKVYALAARYGEHYGIDIRAVTEYVTTLADLEKLFHIEPETERSVTIPILCGMVDNNRTRMLLHEFFHSGFLSELIYLDAGVEGVLVEEEVKDKPRHVAKKLIESSGFSGQVVIGYKRSHNVYLPPVADVYPTILLDEESVFPNQSCGDEIINNPQRGATNKMAAQLANTVVNNLFHTGQIIQSEIVFNAQFGTSQATFLTRHIETEYKKDFIKESVKNDSFSVIS